MSEQTRVGMPVGLVMGASRGLGLLVARNLAARGYQVVICARDGADLRDAAEAAGRNGLVLHPRVCDVTDEAAVRDVLDAAEEEFGPIEVAIHVAGVIQVGPAAAMTRAHYEKCLDIMLWGPVNMCLPLAERMRERGHGHLGVVTSVGGRVSVPHLLPYSTAKFAAVGFTEGLHADLSGTGVTATTIVPGLMRTGSHLQAEFTGDQPREFAWFAPAASLPLLTLDAERAAHRMVSAVLDGQATVHLHPVAHIAGRVHGLLPGLTTNVLGLAGRLLPSADGPGTTLKGHEARERLSPKARAVVDKLSVLGRRAAQRFNEIER